MERASQLLPALLLLGAACTFEPPGKNGPNCDGGKIVNRMCSKDAGEANRLRTDLGADTGEAPDADPLDSGAADDGVLDSSTPDSGLLDLGVPDLGLPDAGVPDAGAPDTGRADAGPTDTGISDAGRDAGLRDSGVSLAVLPTNFSLSDLGTCAGPVLLGSGICAVDAASGVSMPGCGPLTQLLNSRAPLLQSPGGAPAVAYCAQDIVIAAGATLRFYGAEPVILVALDSIRIEGTLDVSATPGDPGAGGNDPRWCSLLASPGDSATLAMSGGGGGGGGCFRTSAGSGGAGMNGPVNGGVGGQCSGTNLDVLRGGCSGAAGGGSPTGGGGPGGHASGGIQLVAGNRITVQGRVLAIGEGGTGGGSLEGGGGGGSGGGIILEAPDLRLAQSGALVATGGSGAGGGAPSSTGMAGQPGPLDGTAALGGPGGPPSGGTGGRGGVDAFDLVQDGASATGAGGGGGGGGGSGGIIRLRWSNDCMKDQVFVVSPPPQQSPGLCN